MEQLSLFQSIGIYFIIFHYFAVHQFLAFGDLLAAVFTGYLDLLLANVCKQNVTRFPYEIARLAEDIAGGLMVTAPSEKDLKDPIIGPYVDKYFRGVSHVSTENRLRIMRLIENLTLGSAAVGYRTESLHGAGSPQAQRIMIARQGNLAMKKELAKAIAKIED